MIFFSVREHIEHITSMENLVYDIINIFIDITLLNSTRIISAFIENHRTHKLENVQQQLKSAGANDLRHKKRLHGVKI